MVELISRPPRTVRTASPPFFFILGRGRSGTGLLRALLNAHPEIAVPPEGQFILLTSRKYQNSKWSPKRIESFHKDIRAEKLMKDWDLEWRELKQEFLNQSKESVFSDFCKQTYKHYAARHNKVKGALLGDKNPHYSLFAGNLSRFFPGAKFLHMVRDYRDNILSFKEVRFDLNNTAALAWRWKYYNEQILKERNKQPERFLTLRYEDLVANPDRELTRVCHFLGIEFSSAMYDYHNHPQTNLQKTDYKLMRPINKANLHIWKKRMTQKDLCIAEALCGTLGSFFGYKPSAGRKSGALFLKTLPGTIYGQLFTWLEKAVFYLPFHLRSRLISLYRILTGSLIKGKHY